MTMARSQGTATCPVRAAGGFLAGALARLAGWVQLVADEAAARAADEISRVYTSRKLVFFYWQRDVPGLLVAARCASPVARFFRETEFVCDDTYGGRVTENLLARVGGRSCRLRRSSFAARTQDLQAIIRSPAPIGLAVDGNGPYGVVGWEFARLVERCEAVAVPLAARASRAIPVWLRAVMEVPRPGARLALAVGAPVQARPEVAVSAEVLGVALAGAKAAAEEALNPKGSFADEG